MLANVESYDKLSAEQRSQLRRRCVFRTRPTKSKLPAWAVMTSAAEKLKTDMLAPLSMRAVIIMAQRAAG